LTKDGERVGINTSYPTQTFTNDYYLEAFVLYFIQMTLPRIIGVLGRSRVGKDTFAQVVVAETDGLYQVHRLASPLKGACISLFGFTHEQVEGPEKEQLDVGHGIRPRDAMIWLTQQTMAFAGQDFFSRRLWGAWDRGLIGPYIIVPDIRYEHDIEWVRERGGVVVKIERTGAGVTHEVEDNIDTLQGDYLIKNEGHLGVFEERVRDWAAGYM